MSSGRGEDPVDKFVHEIMKKGSVIKQVNDNAKPNIIKPSKKQSKSTKG